MESLKSTNATSKIAEYTTQDTSTIYYRQLVITQLHKMDSTGASPDFASNIPNPDGTLALTGISASYNNGIAKIEYYFQGERDSAIQTDMVQTAEGTLSQEPITSHPKIDDLVSNYAKGMKAGKVLWKEYLAEGGTNGTDSNGNAVSNLNPFSNVDSFLNAGMTYTISQSFATPPDLKVSSVGKIATTAIFGNLPQLSSDYGTRGWLYAGFSIEQRGAVYQVTLHYLKSGPGGWLSDIYS